MVKQDFNRGWSVYKEGFESGVREVNLPHDAMIYEARSKEAATAGACGYFEGGKYIYTKKFNAPAEWEGKVVFIEFEAVYKNAAVYLNGELVAERPYGYSNFYAELTNGLKIGGENELKVIADNSKCPNSRWYSGSGIYREVQLYVANASHIALDGVKITTPDEQTVEVDAEVVGGDKAYVEILDGEVVIAGAEAEVVQGKAGYTFTIPDAKTWDDEHPNLYICKVSLMENGRQVDECAEEFGIRTLSWSTEGFFVNGRETLFRGGCIHHDNGILGACNFADAEERRVRILKEAGFNAIRSSHNPMSKAMLAACDRLGMYVMDETFDQWIIHKNPYDYAKEDFEIWWKEDTKAMVLKDYNHPSVVMYSIGNEISELGIPKGQALCGEQAEFVKSLDSTRAVTAGVNIMLATMAAKGKGMYGNGGEDEKENKKGSQSMYNMPTSTIFNMMMNLAGDMMDKMSSGKKSDAATEAAFSRLDISGYNYATSRYEADGGKYPNRIIVGSETLPKKLYTNWKLVEKLPYLIGDFMWTSWDYLGESGIGTVQYKSFKQPGNDGLIVSGGAGIVDICGKQRPEVEWGKIIWGLRDTPAIGVDPVTHSGDKASISMWRDTDTVASWSWAGCEGKKTRVVVYSDAAKVELKVNEKSYGKKAVKECKAFFKGVAYQPGRIEAIAYDASGAEVSRSEMRTATGKTSLQLTPEKTVLRANGQDLCYLDIDLVGDNKITKSSADCKVTVKVEGAGTLQAFGSARPNMGEDFYSDTHTTYYGKALAVVRAGYEPGEIKVTVSAEGLKPRTLAVKVDA